MLKTKLYTGLLITGSFLYSMSSIAAPVTWQLTFFKNNGEAIGNGQFSYDPNSTTCVYTTTQGCNGTVREDFDVQTEIESTSIHLGGYEWGAGTPRPLEATIAWWSDSTANVLPGIMGHGKAGIHFERNQWRFHSGETFSPAQ